MTKYITEDYVSAPKNQITVDDIIKANRDGINNPDSHLWYQTPVLMAAMHLGQKGIDLSESPVVEGIRYGAAADSGLSTNYQNDSSEWGLSLAQEANQPIIGSHVWFCDRKAYEYRGIKIGTGSDGETLILPLHVENWD